MAAPEFAPKNPVLVFEMPFLGTCGRHKMH